MLGGPSIFFHKPRTEKPAMAASSNQQQQQYPPLSSSSSAHNTVSPDHGWPMDLVRMQQQLSRILDDCTRSLGAQFYKAVDDTTGSFRIMGMPSANGIRDGRKVSGSCPPHSVCFASISGPLVKHDHNQQAKVEDLKESAEKMGEDLRVPVPEANVPGIGDVKSLALKQLLCGIVAGAVASFVVSPFQILRTRVIAGRGGSSAGEVLNTVTQIEGIESLLKGNLKVTLIATSIEKGLQFATFEAVKRKEQQKLGKDPQWLPGVSRKVPISTVAGAVAGLTSTLVIYPLSTLMDRMILKPSEYSSLVGGTMKLIKKGPLTDLYRGIVPAILTMIPQAAVSFYTYETVSKHMREKQNQLKERFDGPNDAAMTAIVSISAGTAAGLVAAALTYPLEVARKQISLSALPQGTVGIGGAISYNSLPQALSGIVQREGFAGLYRGFVVQALQFVPMTAVSFAVYEVTKRVLVAQHEERRDEVKG